MTTDTRFITNEQGRTLVDRFVTLIGNDTTAFDCLVGYFYSSGFHLLRPSLEQTDKIRVLIGLNTDQETFDQIQLSRAQSELNLSHAETKEHYAKTVIKELETVEETKEVEEGVRIFIDWLKSKKLEIRAFPDGNLHAKLYIMTHKNARDKGRIVTGSSNFSVSGLKGNLELNVELKDPGDYDYALAKFNELWEKSVDVSEKYVQTVNEKTWLNDGISPYELYLKLLYEYFQEEINQTNDEDAFIPEDYMKLAYQDQAVMSAVQIIRKYGGVFLSDVVGLGKTYISALLAQRLRKDGRILVLAPPHLLDRNNQGSWKNVFYSFDVSAKFESIGQLDKIIDEGTEQFKTVFIDEAHRFRSDDTETYEKLSRICYGKQVVLVTATPYNNKPSDILSLLKLFQKPHDSTIPGHKNLQHFFNHLETLAKKYDRQRDYESYIRVVRENARKVRENILKHVMVRRTRTEVTEYFKDDILNQKLTFPEVAKPEPLLYKLNNLEERIFKDTVSLIKTLTYSRYVALLYLKEGIKPQEQTGQKNLRGFIKILLVKRMESSIEAFRSTLDRFLHGYEMFLKGYNNGSVYFSAKHSGKIFDALELDNDDEIDALLESGKAEEYDSKAFNENLKPHLEADIAVLKQIIALWEKIDRDPKLLELLNQIKTNKVLQKSKLIIFTEAEVTAKYLSRELEKHTGKRVIAFSGHSTANDRSRVIDNFDAKARTPKDEFDILVTTEVLAEGVNLHRSNVIINYDIPWNPTRLMQRVGRINRVGTKFDKIYTFNFFPTAEVNDEIALQEAAEAKIESFIEMLGADAKLLTDNENASPKGLFDILNSKSSLEDEGSAEGSDLRYLRIIQAIRDDNPDLFKKIKSLPRKARSARQEITEKSSQLVTYFRKGYLTKFMASTKSGAEELDFMGAARLMECKPDTKGIALTIADQDHLYALLDKNKEGFSKATEPTEDEPINMPGSRSTLTKLRELTKVIRKSEKMMDIDEAFLKEVMDALEKGVIPKKTAQKAVQKMENSQGDILKMLAILRSEIDETFLQPTGKSAKYEARQKREVILSLYQKAE
ncbi:MAG: helicase-related protein [Micavibrio sp.]|nr:helicase-related protein [Micavibrio sp.]